MKQNVNMLKHDSEMIEKWLIFYLTNKLSLIQLEWSRVPLKYLENDWYKSLEPQFTSRKEKVLYCPHVLLEIGCPCVGGTSSWWEIVLAAKTRLYTPRNTSRSQLMNVKPAANHSLTTTQHPEVTRITWGYMQQLVMGIYGQQDQYTA